MSENERVARPASYTSARPLVQEQRPTSYHASQPAGDTAGYQIPSRPDSRNNLTPIESHHTKPIGMYSILNPAAPRQMPSIDGRLSPTSRRPSGSDATGSMLGQSHINRSLAQIVHTSASLPGTPNAKIEAVHGKPPFSERNSPTTGYPFPKMDNPTRPQSSQQLRPLSYQEKTSRDFASCGPPLQPPKTGSKRPHESSETGPDLRQYTTGEHHAHRIGTPPIQVLQSPEQQEGSSRVGDEPGSRSGTRSGLEAYQQAVKVANQSGETSSPEKSHTKPWVDSTTQPSSGTLFAREPHQAFIQLPGGAGPIPIQVDYSQASKKADEKRQRNAKASTRHRRKKKNMQEENVRQLQDLKDERQQMMYHIEELSRHCDFYKTERNRLRNIVTQTPGLSHHAAGPVSPRPLPNILSYIEDSPEIMVGHIQTPPQGYASETPSLERPAQRRRTDGHAEYQQPQPHMGGPAPLPPLQGPPPRPHSAAPPVPGPGAGPGSTGKLLPPLRAIDTSMPYGGPGMPRPGGHHEQDPATGHWRPAQPRPYETGWATNVRG